MTPDHHPRPRLAVAAEARPDVLTEISPHVDRIPLTQQPTDIDGYVFHSASQPDAPPNLPAEEDDRLDDPDVRDHFLERVFAHARLRALFTADWRPRDLIAFHSRHKMQILAHDPAAYREMGRLVAEAGTRPHEDLERDYRRTFNEALAVHPSRGRHTNALLHVLSPMTARLDPAQRNEVVAAIDSYQHDHAPLSAPMTLLRRHAEGHTYLAQQTYLDPYPAELRDV